MSSTFLKRVVAGAALGTATLFLVAPGAAVAGEPEYQGKHKGKGGFIELKLAYSEDLKVKYDEDLKVKATVKLPIRAVTALGGEDAVRDLENAQSLGELADALRAIDGMSSGGDLAGAPYAVPRGAAAAGGGGLATDTTGMLAGGVGLLGVAALGGTALLRRRASNGTLA